MNVICKDKDGALDLLTVGKIYDVISLNGNYYVMINDGGNMCGYNSRRFYTLGEYRNIQLDKIIE